MYTSFRSLISRPMRMFGLAFAAGAMLLAGCGSPPPASTSKSTVRTMPRSVSNANLGWVGSYRTNAPCPQTGAPGCTSQTLMLMLNPDNTYSLTTTMLRRGRPYTFTSSARFRWDASRTVIILASKDESARLRVGRNTLERIGTESMSPEEAASHPLVYTRD